MPHSISPPRSDRSASSDRGAFTRALQAEIDRVSASGGGVVRVADGEHRIGTLFLRNGVTLHLGAKTRLIGSDQLEDYPIPRSSSFVDAVGQQRGRSLIIAEDAHDVGISGDGIIDGSGEHFPEGHPSFAGRPFLCRFIRCRNVRLREVRLMNSAAWVCHLLKCTDVLIERISIDSRVNHNNDGLDIDSCQRVVIRRCSITSGDDSICLKTTSDVPCEDIVVENCTLWSQCGTIKMGTESYGDFRRVRIHDCIVEFAGLSAIKLMSMDGGRIDDVQISNIQIESGTGPIFVRLGDRGRTYEPGQATKPAGAIRNVEIRNIRALNITVPAEGGVNYFTKERVDPLAFSGILITGISNRPIENLLLHDVNVHLPGGGGAELLDRAVPQMKSDYPEHFYFGPTPAKALYARHVRGLNISNFYCTTDKPDARPEMRFDDVEQSTP